MDSRQQWVVPLSEAANLPVDRIGGKASKLAIAEREGFVVPCGFCVTTDAYEEFLFSTGLAKRLAMELDRKSLDTMRWEEIWDTALRIRLDFLREAMPESISDAIGQAMQSLGEGAVAVRSSAVGEDSAGCSFAGLHESIIGVTGLEEVSTAIRRVWASLWSDAALLYRKELALDPKQSRMAVLVQLVVEKDRSGVAFGRDPRKLRTDCAIVESVPGPCSLLVDGSVDPDRWFIKNNTGEIVEWHAGIRDQSTAEPLLDTDDLTEIFHLLVDVEMRFGWPPDIEWTGRAGDLTLLQARPITTAEPDASDERSWYLTLRPGSNRLTQLAQRVSEELIPALEDEGERLAREDLDDYTDQQLASTIESRFESLEKWEKIYWDDFIPFAHGVRQLARYYNDAVRPDDPYQFAGLLQKQDMLAMRRNRAFAELADRLRANPVLKNRIDALVEQETDDAKFDWQQNLETLEEIPGGKLFTDELDGAMQDYMDITVGSQRMIDNPGLLLHYLIEMTESKESGNFAPMNDEAVDSDRLERLLYKAVGEERRQEAADVIRIGRLSWRLRDDDNLLVSRIESQLFRALTLGVERLKAAGRLAEEGEFVEAAVPVIIEALRDPSQQFIVLPRKEVVESSPLCESVTKPRQLIGQPAAPGLASGVVRRIEDSQSFARFRAGEILLCDAIQPMMTHLVPLAAAVVERRGGMLIHGAIIARELGIPCVNGIVDLMNLLQDGDLVTVDGHLGIVTVGPPEFDLELQEVASETY